MSIPDYATLLRRLNAPTQVVDFCKSSAWATGNNLNTTWSDLGNPTAGVTPSTAAIPDNTFQGSVGQANPSVGPLRAWCRALAVPVGGGAGSVRVLLVDRLAHVGGLSGIVTTPQTVTFPSLTRYTSGVNVFAAAEIYTSVGGTATTLTISYTNQAGTAGQTSQPVNFGGAGNSTNRTVIPLSLASGDSGVQNVASATVLATTGTAGNFGITLYKTLASWWTTDNLMTQASGKPLPFFGALPQIQNGACLQVLHGAGGQASTLVGVTLNFFED